MSNVAGILLGWFMLHGNPGETVYSFEPFDGCRGMTAGAACDTSRVCALPGALCAPPRWSAARGAWVRVETESSAERRWRGIFESAERVARRVVACKDSEGSVIEDCEPSSWPRGQWSKLAFVLATTAYWESGLREDIQFGYPPAGRGPDGEVCLIQVMPDQIPSVATWLPKADRTREYKRDELEALAQTLLGDSPEALDRCFEVGARHLARARRACAGKGIAWELGMWSMYGSGNTCAAQGFPEKRSKTLRRLEADAKI